MELDLTLARGLYTLQTGGTVTESANAAAINSLNTDSRVKYAYPVFANPTSGARHYLNKEIVVRMKAPITPDDVASFQQLGLQVADTLSSSDQIHVLRLTDPKNYNPFSVCSALLQNPAVLWDEPNMEQEGGALDFHPNDAKYGDQWHLPKVSAPSAWDLTLGSPGIRIAILDNGVIWQNNGMEITHPDLQPNIIQGYDFKDMDADPNPSTSGQFGDNHGTAVAGVAAALVNNNCVGNPPTCLGVVGMAPTCKILPVRVFQTDNGVHTFATPSHIYQALVYAADNADVINCSWSNSPSSTVSAGFSYAWNQGRGGKGCAVFCASGNSAAGEEVNGNLNSYETLQIYNIYNAVGQVDGTYRIGFQYKKDDRDTVPDDTVWLADITMPPPVDPLVQQHERLDSLTLPRDWMNDTSPSAHEPAALIRFMPTAQAFTRGGQQRFLMVNLPLC